MRAGVHSQVPNATARLEAGLHDAPVPISLWVRTDGVFRIADVNDATCDHLGLTRDELLGASAGELGGNQERATRDMLRAAAGKTVTREVPRVFPSGDVRDLRVVYVGSGPDEVLAFALDVTSQRHTEERLRIAENRYRTLVSAANEGVWLVDASGRTSFANAKVAQLLGRPLAEIAQRNLLDFVDDRDRATVAGAIECPRDTPAAFEARFRDSEGGELLCLMSVSAVPGDGEAPATLCLLADMTTVQLERGLRRATEERFRWIVETASEGIWTGDPDGITTFVNEACARMLGRDRFDMIGRPFTDFVVYDDAAHAARRELVNEGRPLRREFRMRRPDGRRLDVATTLSLLRDDQDKVIGSLAMLSDVTQRKAEHAELVEGRERFAQVFEESPVGMAFIGAGRLARGRLLGANRALHELLGYAEGELVGQDLQSVTHPDDAERERTLATELFDNKRSDYEIDKRFIRADGSVVWARFRSHVVRDERGAPLYGLGLALDITPEKAAVHATADTAARAQALMECTPDALVEADSDGQIVDMNGAALRMFGVGLQEVCGKPVAETLLPERLRDRLTHALAEWRKAAAAAGPAEPTETTMQRADGSEFPAELRVAAVGEGRLWLYVRNLALHDRAETARREAEERFERLFRDGPVAAVAIDLQGRLTDVNPAFCELAACQAPGLIGRDAAEVLADAGDAHEAPWRSGAARPGPLAAARRVMRPDGHGVPVQLVASLVRDAAGAPLHWLCQCTPKLLADAASLATAEPLSYRERQVLGLLAHGYDGPAIAERLGLSSETVRSYAQTAREKLGAKTRTEAVALALMHGEIAL